MAWAETLLLMPGPDLHVPLELVILISESDGVLMEGGVGGGMHRHWCHLDKFKMAPGPMGHISCSKT